MPFDPANQPPQDFMGWQQNTYGMPKRKRTGQQPQQPQTPSNGVPFMPNGQPMPEPGQPQQPQGGNTYRFEQTPTGPQASAQPAAPQGAGPDPFESIGGGVFVNGGWVPKGHPSAQGVQQQAPQGQQAQGDPRLGQKGNVTAEGIYQAGNLPNYVYNPQNIQQFQAPNTNAINNQQQQLVQQLLNNPQTLNPQVVDQLKGASQDQAALMEKQQLGQLRQGLASHGRSVDAGQGLAMQQALQNQTNQGLLGNYRNIDIQAANQNRADTLGALGAGTDFQNQTLQRAISGYGAGLQGQQLQGNEQKAFIDSIMGRAMNQEQLLGQQASTTQGAIGNRNNAQQISNQANQFGQSFGLQQDQFNYGKQQDQRQFDASQAAQGAANGRWEDQMAFQYQQQQQNEYNSLLQYLMGGGQ